METRLLIDWISATNHKPQTHLQYTAHPALHDWENWEITNGANGYTIGAKHESGAKVYYNPDRKDMGRHIIYSGKVLERINQMYSINSMDVLKYHIETGHNIARIDIALDFVGSAVTVVDFQDAFVAGQSVTRLRSASVIKSLTDRGHTFYIGSKKKRKKLIRIYDKSAEQNWDFPCIRVELQLMGKPATKVAIDAIRGDSVKAVLLGAIKDVIDFPLIQEWTNAMENAENVNLGTEYDGQGDTLTWLNGAVRTSIIKYAVLNMMWWTQFKLDIDIQVKEENQSLEQ